MRRNKRRLVAGLLSLILLVTCLEHMTIQASADELEQQELEISDVEKNADEEIELPEDEDDVSHSKESEIDEGTDETDQADEVDSDTQKEDTDESGEDIQEDGAETDNDEEKGDFFEDNIISDDSNEDREEEKTEEIENIENNSIEDEESEREEIAQFKLNHTELTMSVCSTNYLTINSEIVHINEKDIFWESSNEEVVYVEDGEIAALSTGTAVITAKDKENGTEASCKVNVISQQLRSRALSTYSTSYNASSALAYAEKNWNVNAYTVKCSEFVSNCIKAGGIPSNIWSQRATVLRNLLKSSGLGTEYSCQFSSDGYFYKSNAPSVIAPGDVVFYYCASCDDGKPYSIHVVLFNGFDENGRMKAYSHNGPSNGASAYKYSTENGAAKCYDCGRQISTLHVYHFNGNDGVGQNVTNTPPHGALDLVSGGEGTITVAGWAFDQDDYSKYIAIHVYVGGPAGSGKLYAITANQNRSDVVNIYPSAQANCGFHQTIKVTERGNQSVYVYAIDAQDSSKHSLLGSKTATINSVSFSMQFGQSPINLSINESKDFSCKFTGDGIHHLSYTLSDSSVANMVGLSDLNWTSGTCNIRVKGLKTGTTTMTIYLMDSNDKQLYSKPLSITVKQPVTSVSLNKSSASLEVGKTEKLTVTVVPSNASNKNVTWSSSNTNIATVSNGVITAKSTGTATITAAAADGSGKKATCSVTVKKASTPFSITFDQSNVSVNKGSTKALNITFKGDGIYTLGYAFIDSSVASVTWGAVDYTKGTTSITLKGLKAGSTSLAIHLIDSGGKSLYSKNIGVNVSVPLQNITLNKTSGKLKVGETDSLTVSYYPSDTTDSKAITWTSSNTNVATVSGGKITAKSEGTATITATVQNKKATYNITVVSAAIKVSNISLSDTNIQLYLDSNMDKRKELSVSIVPSNATNKEIIWSSSDTKVVSVSNKGMVTAIASGTATITATAADGSGKKASCLVTVKNSSWDGAIYINANEIVTAEGKEDTHNQIVYGGKAANITITFGDNSIAEYRPDGDLFYGTGSEERTILNFYVKGIKAGKTNMTVTVYDDNGKILGSESIPVTVIRKVTGVSFDKNFTIIKVGESEQLNVNIEPVDATVQDVSWETFEDSITCVDGVVTGNKMDVAMVRVRTKDGNYMDTMDIVVVDDSKLDTMMSSVPEIITVEKGEEKRIELPYREYSYDFDWAWDNVLVEDNTIASARVGHAGGADGSICYLDVTGKSEGYTKVRISYEWAGESIYSKDILVQVVSEEIPVQSIRLNVSNLYLTVGQSKTVNATVYPTDATNKDIIWSSDNPDIASVIGGTVYGLKEGIAWIKASSEDDKISSKSIPVYVSKATDGIWLNENNLMMVEGEKKQLIARIEPEDNLKKIEFASSDSEVVMVDDRGNITAVKKGTAVITASVDEGAVQSHCVVTVTADLGEVPEEDIPDTGIPNGIWAVYERSVLYTGAAVTPDIRVYDGKVKLTEGIDYSSEYKNNVNAGIAYILINGKGKYSFNKQFEFSIIGADINDVSIRLKSASYSYTGREIFPELIVTDAGVDLVEGKDYISSYLNNISVGTGTVILKGTGRYTGEARIGFEIKEKEEELKISIPERLTIRVDESIELPVSITPKDVVAEILITSDDEEVVSVNSDRYVITGHKPGSAKLSVYYNDRIKYCTVTVTQSNVQTDILPEDMPDNGIIPDGIWIAGVEDKTYVGSPIRQSFRVYDGEILLQEGKDYSVTYKNNKASYLIQDKNNLSKIDINKAPKVMISMKGIYTGRKILYFDIAPADISTSNASDFSAAYVKKGQKPIPTVIWNKIKLKNKKDFTVEYRNMNGNIVSQCTEPGIYTIIIHGKGNFSSDTEKRISLIIADTLNGEVPVNKLSISVDKKTAVYRGGNPVIPVVTVKDGKNVLEINKDYKTSFFNNTEVGTGYLSITGLGKYTGVRTIGFPITGIPIDKYKLSKLDTLVYNGCAQKQSDYVLEVEGDQEASLIEGKDYTVSYMDNVNVGKATISFTGINEFDGKLKRTFKIVPLHLEEALTNNFNSIVIEGYSTITGMSTITEEYKKNGAKPLPVIYYRDGNGDSRLLREGVDFKTSYKNNKQVYERKADDEQYDAKKAPTIVITGIGNFSGTLRIPFRIEKQDLSGKMSEGIFVSAADMKYKYKKNNFMQSVKVLDADGKRLISKKDYTLRYLNEHGQEIMNDTIMPINSVITVEVTANRNSEWYAGTCRATFMLKGEVKDIAKGSFKISNKEYTGTAVKLVENDFVIASYGSRDNRVMIPLIVSDNEDGTYMTASGEKTDGGFEIIKYSNNIRKGKAYVTIRGVGVYSGTRVLTYKIGSRSINTFWSGLYISLREITG